MDVGLATALTADEQTARLDPSQDGRPLDELMHNETSTVTAPGLTPITRLINI
jgi:hypothetical protein